MSEDSERRQRLLEVRKKLKQSDPAEDLSTLSELEQQAIIEFSGFLHGVLLAERERAAKVAKGLDTIGFGSDDYRRGFWEARRRIAAAIREGKKEGERS